jgi:betaine-aldehyde dehydrogenase
VHSIVVHEPVGVCALITPWNYPLLQASWKIAPALAAGNTFVIKPSEVTPLSTVRLVELVVEAGAPAGVANIVTGAGDPVGARFGTHPGVDLVSFTGGLASGTTQPAPASWRPACGTARSGSTTTTPTCRRPSGAAWESPESAASSARTD